MSKPLLAVVGGTGTQGLSLINAALKDGTYGIRALTRNISSDKAQKLREKGVEVVQADVDDEQSLIKAFEGATAAFGMTDFYEPFAKFGVEKAIEIESSQGINIAKAAAATPTLKHYIWSTLPNATKLTKGRYEVPHFDAKAKVDDFIRTDAALFAKTTFLWVTFYGNNFQYAMFTPTYMKSNGAWVQLSPASASTQVTMVGNPLKNIGIFALAALQQPHVSLPGKYLLASNEQVNAGDQLKIFSEVTGKRAVYVQTSLEHFDALWPGWGKEMGVMMMMWDEYKEESWTGEEGIITQADLGLAAEEFGTFRDNLKEMDWATLLG